MKTSPRGIEDLVLSEGLRTKAYRDSVGVWTIGVGHAATSGAPPIPRAGMTITRQEALDILARDLARYEKDVNAVLPNVPQHVFDGAVSFHFNTGAIKKASWVGKYKAGDMAGARAAFMSWRKPPEIIGRRTREADLIFKGKYHSKATTPPTPPPPPLVGGPILRKGDGIASATFREDVKEAQQLLDAAGFPPGAMDGKFGLVTEAKVIAFQRARGLTPDGVIGPATWAALRQPNPASSVMGSGDIDLAPVEPDHDDDFDLPAEPKETTVFKGKQKAWVALLMPVVATAVFGALETYLGIVLDPTLKTGILAVLTGGSVYQVANTK